MKIEKYKKSGSNKYKVYLEDGRELLLYEEVILKYELLLKREILDKDMSIINLFNLECDVYYVALNNLKTKYKSVHDLREVLSKKEYPKELIENAINKLINQGYLNDQLFARSYINNSIVTTCNGPFKIYRELSNKGIDSSIINNELEIFSEEKQREKIKKLVNRMLKSNRTRGGAVLKRKIMMDLNNYGYGNDLINKVLIDYSFENDVDIAKKEYDKLYTRLSRKYSGKELEYKIKEKLYQKGLYYED